MSDNLTLDGLRELVRAGEIDTVLVCFPDMQGRLMGKRVTGHFFLDQVVEEMHVCDYLLTVDMDMGPVPGYAAASWQRDYGDFAVKSDLATLRHVPWLEATALVMGDGVDHDGALGAVRIRPPRHRLGSRAQTYPPAPSALMMSLPLM